MKTLYLVRHAKSSWADPSLTDFERPLNDRGRKNAPEVATYLVNKGIIVNHFVSSPATRAITTARIFADKMGFPRKNIQIEAGIYNASKQELIDIIKQLDNKHNSIALFGHDTSITVATEELSNQRFLHFPTCGVAGIRLNVNQWADVTEGCGDLLFFYFPKGIAAEEKAKNLLKP